MASSLEAAGEPVPTSAVLMSASKHIAVRCRGVLPGIGENISSTSCAKVIMLKLVIAFMLSDLNSNFIITRMLLSKVSDGIHFISNNLISGSHGR
ncbi:hypothetical protein Hdeb2414_s0439g00893951 [Helianthus debilis subsp. tardiflorus]